MDDGHDLAKLRKFPYPYRAGLTVSSDIDNASAERFRAIHSLICGSEVIRPDSPEWRTLGLSQTGRWYDPAQGGVPGLGLDLADSFFLIADNVSMGMYHGDPQTGRFTEDISDGRNACELIREGLRRGQIDTFHTFLHYPREKVLPLLTDFYHWCRQEGVAPPRVWVNHSPPVTPTGLCPGRLRPNRWKMLARSLARWAIGPLFGRPRRPILHAFRWYKGDSPGSRYYVNDILAAHGLRYVWLCASDDDLLPNVISLPERNWGDQSSILNPVTMDDGVTYFRFRRCYGKINAPQNYGCCLRQSADTIDTSTLFTDENLDSLCRQEGTCILFTHWTLARSFPIQDEVIEHFVAVRKFRDQGKVWVAPQGKLLEWTRLRTFLQYSASRQGGELTIDIAGVEDPVCGRTSVTADECRGLAFEIPSDVGTVSVRLDGQTLPGGDVQRAGTVCWIGQAARPGGGGAKDGQGPAGACR
jgi:hypothetical protein